MNMIMRLICLGFMLDIVSIAAFEDTSLKLNIEMNQPTFAVGIPIAIKLKIQNQSVLAEKLIFNYPSLITDLTPGLELILDEHKLQARCLPTESCENFNGEGRLPTVEVPASGEFSVLFFLNRFCKDVTLGKHTLSYVVVLPVHNGRSIVKAKGKLEFEVVIPARDAVGGSLNEYLHSISSSSYWDRRASAEAIMVDDNTRAIPYQIELSKMGYSEYAFPGLAQFSNDDNAQKVIIAALSSERPRVVTQALQVLSFWKHEVTPNIIEKLSESKDVLLRRAVAEYCHSIRGAKLRVIAAKLTNDSDLEVARFAKEFIDEPIQRLEPRR